MSFCQLRLATQRPKSVLKNGSSQRGTCETAIHYQLDRVDVRGIVRRKKENGFGNFFRLAPTALRNRGREELRCGIGSCGVPRPSLAPYATATGATKGGHATEGRSACPSSPT